MKATIPGTHGSFVQWKMFCVILLVKLNLLQQTLFPCAFAPGAQGLVKLTQDLRYPKALEILTIIYFN
jgi:hypothetical protein